MAAHRYWRLWLLASNYGSATSFAETQFRTTPGTPLLFSNAANASAGSAYGGIPGTYDGSHAADNNPSTLWAGSAGFPDWWQYDYGAGNALDIKEVTITARNDAVPEQTPSSFTLQYSDDNSAFTNVQTFTAATWSLGQTQVFTVAAAPGFVDLAGNLAPSLTFSASLTSLVGLAGDLAPSTTLAANLTVVAAPVDLAGGLTPSWAFAADLTIVSAAGNYVDFAGNIGSPSSYGKLSYGEAHYSRGGPFAPIFAGSFDIVGQDFFAGDLAPVVTFSGALAVDEAWGGDLAPIVTFSATLTIPAYVDFTGNLAPVVTLGGALSVDYVLGGDLPPQVTFNAALALDLAFEASMEGAFAFTVAYDALSMISGPLWGDTEPCPTPPWGPSEPCPPSLWTPTEPCDPVEWEETEKCNG